MLSVKRDQSTFENGWVIRMIGNTGHPSLAKLLPDSVTTLSSVLTNESQKDFRVSFHELLKVKENIMGSGSDTHAKVFVYFNVGVSELCNCFLVIWCRTSGREALLSDFIEGFQDHQKGCHQGDPWVARAILKVVQVFQETFALIALKFPTMK